MRHVPRQKETPRVAGKAALLVVIVGVGWNNPAGAGKGRVELAEVT